MSPTSEDTSLLPSVDEFSSWNEEQVVEFLLSHSKEINALTHEHAKALKDIGMVLKQAVLLKAIVERIINGSKGNTTSSNSQSKKTPITNSIPELSESSRLQVSEIFEVERRYGKRQSYEELGRGAFGTVYRVSSVKKKKERALKVMFSKTKREINESFKEAFQLIKFNHEHIVKVYDAFMSEWKEEGEEKDVVCIEMEYMKHGSLVDYFMKTNQTAIPEEVILSIIHQISTALKYLLEHFKLVHRDIKPGNILIKKLEGNTIHVCLSDFGFAKTYNHGSTMHSSFVGTDNFLSPEIYKANETINQSGQSKNVYTEQSDVFALGMTMYQLMTGDFNSHGTTLSNIRVVRNELVSKMKLQYSDNLIDLVVDMMDVDLTKRPSLDHLIQSTHSETGDLYIGFSCFEKKDYSNALQYFTKASEGRNMIAHWFLGFMYENGFVSDLKSDFTKAVQFYQRSYLRPIQSNENFATIMVDVFTKQNNSSGQHNLGRMFEIGFGVPQDYSKAIGLYLKSAQEENSNAYNNLGRMYLHGYGLDMDHVSAFEWFQKSANKKGGPNDINGSKGYLFKMFENGNCSSMGQYNLGRLLEPNLFSELGVKKDYLQSLKWYEKSAQQNNTEAIFRLGCIYISDPPRVEKSIMYFQQAANQGHFKAQFNMLFINAKLRKTETIDYGKAFECFEHVAMNGNSYAQYKLGNMYYKGKGVKQNIIKAVEWFSMCLRDENFTEVINLQTVFEKFQTGVNVKPLPLYAGKLLTKAICKLIRISLNEGKIQDLSTIMEQFNNLKTIYPTETSEQYVKLFHLFEISANQGYPNAQFYLALMYYNGEGVEKDLHKAFEWFEKSAQQGHAKAQYHLAVMYQNGEYVQKNLHQAFEWFEKSANQGHTNAQNSLAVMYYNGEGVEQEFCKASEWFEKAAKQGDLNAQHNLAYMYMYGIGVEKDQDKAVEWWKKAAQQGHQKAQYYLSSRVNN